MKFVENLLCWAVVAFSFELGNLGNEKKKNFRTSGRFGTFTHILTENLLPIIHADSRISRSEFPVSWTQKLFRISFVLSPWDSVEVL